MPPKMRQPDKEYRILTFVEDLDEETALLAIQSNAANLQYIQNPSKKVINAALEKMPKAVLHLVNPTKNQMISSICRAPSLFNIFHEHFDANDLITIAADCHQPNWFKACALFMDSAPLHAKKIIWERSSANIYVPANIDSMHIRAQLTYIQNFPNMIIRMKNPSKKIWDMAAKSDPEMVDYVQCPHHAIYTACMTKPEIALDHINVIAPRINKFLVFLAHNNHKNMVKKVMDHEVIQKADPHLVKGITNMLKLKTDISVK